DVTQHLCRPPGSVQNMPNQEGYRRLAVGSGDAHERPVDATARKFDLADHFDIFGVGSLQQGVVGGNSWRNDDIVEATQVYLSTFVQTDTPPISQRNRLFALLQYSNIAVNGSHGCISVEQKFRCGAPANTQTHYKNIFLCIHFAELAIG